MQKVELLLGWGGKYDNLLRKNAHMRDKRGGKEEISTLLWGKKIILEKGKNVNYLDNIHHWRVTHRMLCSPLNSTLVCLGFPMVLHYGCVSEQATISKLVSILNKSNGEVEKSKPRCLTGIVAYFSNALTV